MEEDEQPESDRGTELAEQRTDLALRRTVIAAERTLMAWVRTSLSLIGFGFTVYKFFQYLWAAGARPQVARPYAPRNFGLAMIVLGTLALILAVWQHRGFLVEIGADQPKYVWSLSVVVASAVILIGILAFVGVFLHTGPF